MEEPLRRMSTALTPEVQDRICEGVRMGMTYALAARYGGVSYESFRIWRKVGRDEIEEGKESRFTDFVRAVETAETEGVKELLQLIRSAAPRHWVAAAWLLERRYPESYSQRTIRQISGHGAEGELIVKVSREEKLPLQPPDGDIIDAAVEEDDAPPLLGDGEDADDPD